MTDDRKEKRMEILLVEDNAADVRLTEENLKDAKLSHNLTVIEDGEAALAYLKREGTHAAAARPDLILLDLNLPRKDGRDVLAEIKADPDLKDIPVVVLTGSRDDADMDEAYDLNAPFINKPVEVEELKNVVQLPSEFWMTAEKPEESEND